MQQVIVLTESTEEEIRRISDITHSAGIPLIVGQTTGLCGKVFCDFGEQFVVRDPDGEEPVRSIVATISQVLEKYYPTLGLLCQRMSSSSFFSCIFVYFFLFRIYPLEAFYFLGWRALKASSANIYWNPP